MTTEYRFVSFRQPLEKLIPARIGEVRGNTINFGESIPELAPYMDGWDVVNTQIIPMEDSFLWVFTLRLEVKAPEWPGDVQI